MPLLINHDTLEVEVNTDKDGELEICINGLHGDDDKYVWINKEQAYDLIEKVRIAFDI